MLENFKKLTNSFLHTSNSCQIANTVICNLADLFSAVALMYNSETEREEKKQKAVEKQKGLDETQFVR